MGVKGSSPPTPSLAGPQYYIIGTVASHAVVSQSFLGALELHSQTTAWEAIGTAAETVINPSGVS